MFKLTENKKLIIEIIVVTFLLITLFSMRYKNLDADPPADLSISTDVYTDPAQYTLFAKQKIDTDSFTAYDDNRFVFFLKSSVTVLSYLLFAILGVSFFSANLTGLLYSFGAMLLFYFVLRKHTSMLFGILFLLIIGFNYNHIFYGRLSFLEHAMAFYAFLSLFLLIYFRNILTITLAGVFLAVGIFFGKIIGFVFLAPFAVYLIHRFLLPEKKEWQPILVFTGGFVAVTLFWYFFSYQPMKAQVASYVGEQAFSLYGAPEAFDSFDNFIEKYLTFGDGSKLFERIPVAGVLAALYLLTVCWKLFLYLKFFENLKKMKSFDLFLAVMIIAYIGSLMIWNYRPLRYQLVLIYPIAASAVYLLYKIIQYKSSDERTVPYYALPIVFLIAYLPVYQLYGGLFVHTYGSFHYDEQKYYAALWTVLIVILIYFVAIMFTKIRINIPKYLSITLAVIITILSVFPQSKAYLKWDDAPTFTAKDISKDLAVSLAPNAVLSGPFAPSLNLENKLGTVIHMFGVSHADKNLFEKFPITHLLVDSGNESKAKEDYPEIMEHASHIITYHVGLEQVRLYRIAGFTGNAEADSYILSDLERFIDDYQSFGIINNDLLVEFLKKNPDNMTCYSFIAEATEQDSLYQLSEQMFKKAVEFSPTNYNLNARLAKFYQDRYNETQSQQMKLESKHYYEEAIKYAPSVHKLKKALAELNRS